MIPSNNPRRIVLASFLAVLLFPVGCVERTMKIDTRPPGALVVLNDEEVGVSPVRVSFLWYGDYEIILRKPGYETLQTSYRVQPPWYQIPPFDFVAEVLVPTTLHDEHVLPTYELEPVEPPLVEELVERADRMRENVMLTQP